MLARLNHWY